MAAFADRHGSWGQPTRAACLLTLLVVGLMSVGCEQENAAYPNRPITVIVPFSPGGESANFAGLIKRAIDKHDLLPAPIMIEHRPGAGATIGSRHVKEAAPDGYTILMLHEAIITAKYSGKVNYGPESLQPIAATGRNGLVIAVREDSPYKNLRQLLQAAADKPDELVFAANLGAPVHFAGIVLENQVNGARFRYTQTGGGTDRRKALVGGHAVVSAFAMGEFVRYRADGIRALAYCGPERHPGVPDVATAAEQGFEFEHTNMHFWWFPKGTPPEFEATIANALEEALKLPEVRERLAELHCEPLFLTGAPMMAELQERIENISRVSIPLDTSVPPIELWILIGTVLCALTLVIRRPSLESLLKDKQQQVVVASSTGRSLCLTGLTLGYTLLLTWTAIDYRVLTGLFLLAAGWSLRTTERRPGWVLVMIALVLPLLIHTSFVYWFQMQLP